MRPQFQGRDMIKWSRRSLQVSRKQQRDGLQTGSRDGVPLAPATVGELLRRTRKQAGQDLEVVAEQLRIRSMHLKAIEEDRFTDLPGTTYAVGFLRSYAAYLGLDATDLVRRFKTQVHGLEKQARLVFPTPVPEGRIPAGAVLVISLLLVAAAYGGWLYFSNKSEGVADLLPALPEQLKSLVDPASLDPVQSSLELSDQTVILEQNPTEASGFSGGAEQPATQRKQVSQRNPVSEDLASYDAPARASGIALDEEPSAEAVGPRLLAADTEVPQSLVNEEGGVPSPAAASSAPRDRNETSAGTTIAATGKVPSGDVAADVLEPTAVANEANEIPRPPSSIQITSGPAETPRVYGADNNDVRIVLRAIQDSWVQVRDSDDTLLLTRVLRPGDSYRVPDRPGLSLLTGNAGGIVIEVDGNTLPSLGPVGVVRRDIDLDPHLLSSQQSATH